MILKIETDEYLHYSHVYPFTLFCTKSLKNAIRNLVGCNKTFDINVHNLYIKNQIVFIWENAFKFYYCTFNLFYVFFFPFSSYLIFYIVSPHHVLSTLFLSLTNSLPSLFLLFCFHLLIQMQYILHFQDVTNTWFFGTFFCKLVVFIQGRADIVS